MPQDNTPLVDRNGLLNFSFKKADCIEDEVTPDRMQAMVDAINRNAITSVVGGYFRTFNRGKALVIPPSIGGGNSSFHALLVLDASAGGPNPIISVVAGSVTDLTNSGTVWTGVSGNVIYINDPVAGNIPFAVALAGPPVRLPSLQISSGTTVVYINATIDGTTGAITALEIDADTGGGLPPSTSSNWYYLLSSVIVTIKTVKGVNLAQVQVINDGAQSSLNFRSCQATPLTDGTGYTVGT